MIETEMQKLVVDAVINGGGFAHKMSNRFLIGVADLLIKSPNYAAGVAEVKRHDYGKSCGDLFQLDVTVPQKTFLHRAQAARMPAGVISFTQQAGKGLKSLEMAAYTLDEIEDLDYIAANKDHQPLGHPDFRDDIINKIIQDWLIRSMQQILDREK